ncbi:MAG: hypothetical protein GY820_28995 [Gammaproteobacteria bacterium]|nr:hypothetical protein [Gammaproteobacteria bacterium]
MQVFGGNNRFGRQLVLAWQYAKAFIREVFGCVGWYQFLNRGRGAGLKRYIDIGVAETKA